METIKNEYRIAAIRLPPMYKHQRFQELKLANGIICAPGSLLPLLAENAYADMRLQNHVYIVGAISDGQGYFFWKSSADHVHEVCFLFWGYTAGEDYVHEVGGLEKCAFQVIVGIDYAQGCPSYDDCFLGWVGGEFFGCKDTFFELTP